MIILTTEARAVNIASRYSKKTVICSMSKAKKGVTIGDTKFTYRPTDILPDEDTMNGLVAGDISLKKVIKKTKKLIHTPSSKKEEDVSLCLELCVLLGMSTAVRRDYQTGDRFKGNYKSAPHLVIFLLEDDDKARNKVIIKYLKAIFGEFGLTPLVDDGGPGTLKMMELFCKLPKKRTKKSGKPTKKVKAILRGEKGAPFLKTRKIIDNLTAYANKRKNGQLLSPEGIKYYKTLLIFFDVGVKAYAMEGLDVRSLNKSTLALWTKTLLQTYTGDNIGMITKEKIAKNLAKSNQKAVKAYGVLKDILEEMDPNLVMPKVKYGHKKKGKGKIKKVKGPKMKTKKFEKFFMKRKNSPYLMLVFAHTFAAFLGYGPGDAPYNNTLKGVADNIRPGFGKEFITATNAYAKAKKAAAKEKAERRAATAAGTPAV